jgi:DNA-binding NarL/FixJ family response regulator
MARTTGSPGTSKKKIFIVDDHPVFREGLGKVLAQEHDLSICGEAGTAAEASEKIGRLTPDLVLTDIGLPGKSGLDLIQDLRATDPSLPVLVISMHEESLYAERALRAGARGYVMKHEGPLKMIDAIRKVLDGKVSVSEKIAADILDALSRPGGQDGPALVGKLSNREFEILRLIGQGKDTGEIATALHLSTKTVDTHRGHIKVKLGFKTTPELIHYAVLWVGE